VNYATAFGSALASDFGATSGTLSIPAGTASLPVNVLVTGDTTNEPDESFTVTLSAPTNATIGDGSATGTILNDDGTPSLSINNVTVTETNAAGVNATFTVTLAPISGQNVTVNYATANGSALAGEDFTAGSGTLAIPAGSSTAMIVVPILFDTRNEATESFNVTLSMPTNATINVGTGTGTINDDDPFPSLSIGDATLTEQSATMTFAITLSAVSGQVITVTYATANGTAIAGQDYTAVPATVLTFPAGTLSQNITVSALEDTLDELDETFNVNLTAPSNATISDSSGTGTITDDDAAPTISIGDASITEGNTGSANMNFTVTLSAASSLPISVSYSTVGGTAVSGSDFAGVTGTTLTIPAGSTSGTIPIAITGDVLDEADTEAFTVTLSAPVNVTISDGTGSGTITDDDNPPTISIADVTVTEGNSGTTNAVFALTLSAVSGRTITVNNATTNGTAAAPGDFIAVSSVSAISAGSTTLNITIQVNGDTTGEAHENFTVTLSMPSNVTIADGTATGTINNDDTAINFADDTITIVEVNNTTTMGALTVELSFPSALAVTVDWATQDNSATVAAGDYTAGMGTLTFAPGDTSETITLSVLDDEVDEPNSSDETFFVNLSSATNASIVDMQAVITIDAQGSQAAPEIPDEAAASMQRIDETADAASRAAAISAAGEVVAFESDATNLVEGDTNEATDLFLYERATKTLERLTAGNGPSRKPSLSADGRYVAFESEADDLAEGDTNGKTDVFVLDRLTGVITRASVEAEDATDPALSPDGRYLAFFTSTAVHVHDRATLTTSPVALASGEPAPPASISAGGRFIVLRSASGRVTLIDREAIDRETELSRAAAGRAMIAADARAIALTEESEEGRIDVLLHERHAGAIERISDALEGSAELLDLSGDGRYVLFRSLAVEADRAGVFIRDRRASTTVRLADLAGEDLEDAKLSADGRVLVFARGGGIYLADRP
jgi:hypothetical protein